MCERNHRTLGPHEDIIRYALNRSVSLFTRRLQSGTNLKPYLLEALVVDQT